MTPSKKSSARRSLVTITVLAVAALLVVPVSSATAAEGSRTTAQQHHLSGTEVVPKVVGKTAYAAKSSLAKAGLKYKYLAPKGSFVVLSKSWTVTKQSPKAKSTVKAGTTVKLTVVKTVTLGANPSKPATPAGPALTVAQLQAVLAAKSYLSIGTGFSYQGLIDQLSSAYGNGFSVADATVAVNSLAADYNAQAVLAAKSYLAMGGFSHSSLVQQLTSPAGNKFTPEQGEYAATQVGL
jgi:hypothetical protein